MAPTVADLEATTIMMAPSEEPASAVIRARRRRFRAAALVILVLALGGAVAALVAGLTALKSHERGGVDEVMPENATHSAGSRNEDVRPEDGHGGDEGWTAATPDQTKTVVSGSLKMEVLDATAFCGDEKVLGGLKQAIGRVAKQDAGTVKVNCSAAARRLVGAAAAPPRRLAESVDLGYNIAIPEGTNAEAEADAAMSSIDSTPLTDFTAIVNEELKGAGADMTAMTATVTDKTVATKSASDAGEGAAATTTAAAGEDGGGTQGPTATPTPPPRAGAGAGGAPVPPGEERCYAAHSVLEWNPIKEDRPESPDANMTGFVNCVFCTNGTLTCRYLLHSGATPIVSTHLHFARGENGKDGSSGEGNPVLNFCGDNTEGINDGTDYTGPCGVWDQIRDGINFAEDVVGVPVALFNRGMSIAERVDHIYHNTRMYYFNFHTADSWGFYQKSENGGRPKGTARGVLRLNDNARWRLPA